MPKCFKCCKELSTLKDLCRHLRHGHLLYEPAPIVCAEGGCCRTFTRYNSFYRHVSTCHSQSAPQHLPSFAAGSALLEADVCETGGSVNIAHQPSVSSGCSKSVCTVSSSESVRDIKQLAAQFLLSLSSCSSMTLSQVNFVKESVSDVLSSTIDIVRQSTVDLLGNVASSPGDAKVQNFFSILDKLSKPFDGVDSTFKLEKYVSTLTSYVAPVEHKLGQRWHGVDSQHQQKLIDDKFVYVSVRKTLQCILHLSRCWEEMVAIPDEDCATDVISSYFCGLQFHKLHSLMKENVKVQFYPIVIQLYYDDFETANPLGSKAGSHKLGGFYFTVMNFVRKYNSKLDNINLVALANRHDIVYYGMSIILEPLVKELSELERGFDIVCDDGSVRHVVCILGNVVADNLGLHSILGYTESFSHSYCCDFCLGTADDFQTVFNENCLSLRTRQNYEIHCTTLTNSGTSSHVFGIKSMCRLSQLKYYHPVENYTADIMHDILEGIAPFEVNLLLRDIILTKKVVALDEFNTMLKCFDYGKIMLASKPSEIVLSKLQSSNGLGQHSHQMLVLMYVLPLILCKYVTVNSPNWKLFLLLLEITDIIFSPVLTVGHLSYLAELVSEHHVLFRTIYPEFRLKYKHHRMLHYPNIILNNGPLSHMWVMRYEAKHGYFKRLAHIMCNFRNVCKTLAARNQVRQAVVWSNMSRVDNTLDVVAGKETVVIAHKEFHSLYTDTECRLQEAFLANRIRICGTVYEPGYTVIIDVDADGYPTFGCITKILVCSGVVSFALRQWIVKGFELKTRSYLCLISHHVVAYHHKKLLDYHPLYAHQCSDNSCAYCHIRLRHILCSDN